MRPVGRRLRNVAVQLPILVSVLTFLSVFVKMGIPFTDLSGRVRTSSADDRVIWRRSHSDRLLGEPVEEQAAGL
jgi:hypothetical protein